MSTSLPFGRTPPIKFEYLNWVASDPFPRDRTQSHRLHEPEHRVSTTDPMTGNDIQDVASHPSLVDGNLTIYFDTETTREAYLALPLDHPSLRVPFEAADDDDRGGQDPPTTAILGTWMSQNVSRERRHSWRTPFT